MSFMVMFVRWSAANIQSNLIFAEIRRETFLSWTTVQMCRSRGALLDALAVALLKGGRRKMSDAVFCRHRISS